MHKILIIAQDPLATAYLEKLGQAYPHENSYVVNYTDEAILPEKLPPSFVRHKSDATSFLRLDTLLSDDFDEAVVVVTDYDDARTIIENIRRSKPMLHVVMLEFWGKLWQDSLVSLIPVSDVLTNRLIDFLPSVPTVAKNIGFGNGEIMEVLVPFGSAYAYRHLSNIEQKTWKISALYRGNQFIIGRPGLMIRPNDILLLLGPPSTLRDIYRLIKAEPGQFPAPYGTNMYALCDMSLLSSSETAHFIEQVEAFHAHTKSRRLYFRIVNPVLGEAYALLKAKALKKNYHVLFSYTKNNTETLVNDDIHTHSIGSLCMASTLFNQPYYRQLAYKSRKPIIKIGEQPFSSIKEAVIVLNTNPHLEKISSLYFDLSVQLGLKLTVCDYDPEEVDKKEAVEHFESLAKNYGHKIEINRSAKNPLSELTKKEDILHFIPFDEAVVSGGWHSVFKPQTEKFFWLLKHTQVFIPIVERSKQGNGHESFH